jgi:hypothetical protein
MKMGRLGIVRICLMNVKAYVKKSNSVSYGCGNAQSSFTILTNPRLRMDGRFGGCREKFIRDMVK